MGVSPGDFLSSAQELASLDTEIDTRNAISRAYYAAYHYCAPTAETLPGAVTSKSGTHDFFIETFIQGPSFKAKSIGYMLRQCHSLRIKADYKLAEELRKTDAETVIQQVQEIFRKIDELEGSSGR